MARFPGTLILFVLTGYSHIACGEPPYQLTDPKLKTVLIDSSIRESFLSIRTDTAGRLYVGGREALFVYEPRPDGLYDAPTPMSTRFSLGTRRLPLPVHGRSHGILR